MMDVTADSFARSTERLRLRPMRPEDESLYCRLYSDPRTMRLIGEPLSWDRAAGSFRKLLTMQEVQPMRWLMLAVEECTTMRSIGLIAMPDFNPFAERLEMGLLLDRQAHGKGYPGEALSEFVQCLFSILPVREIWVRYRCENRAADRAARKIGFVRNTLLAQDDGLCIMSAYRDAWHRPPDEKSMQASRPAALIR